MALIASIALIGTMGCSTDSSDDAENDNAEAAGNFEAESGFTQLTLADFDGFPDKNESTWSESRDSGEPILRCSGDPRGYIYTKKEYGNFTLRLEVRHIPPDSETEIPAVNTGVLVYITGEHRVWPACLEVQGKYGELAAIKSNSRDVKVDSIEPDGIRETARKPIGEWMQLEIVSRDGALSSSIDGVQIAESQATEFRQGPIGLQSEGFPFEFRRIRIRVD